MTLETIKATGSEVTFSNVKDFNRQKSAMAAILQKYTRLFREVWPQDYPPLNHVAFTLFTCELTIYSETEVIKFFTLDEQTVSHLENECKDILCRILKGTLI